MAYKVLFQTPVRELGKADATFSAYEDGFLLGELLLSKGAVEWRPSNSQHSYKLNWSQFDRVVQDNGRRRRLP